MRHHLDRQSQDQNVPLFRDAITGIIFPPTIGGLHATSPTGCHALPPDNPGNSWPEDLSHLVLSDLRVTRQH